MQQAPWSDGTASLAGGRLRVAGHVLDLGCGELLAADGRPVNLRYKALELLLVLGERPGQVVSKDELLSRVWPRVVVTEDSLTQAVAAIRRVLGDTRHEWLRTRSKRGYMLVGKADTTAPPAPSRRPGPALPAMDRQPVGRDADLAALCARVADAGLVTLAGAGGIGKTLLAQAAAHRLDGHFDEGVAWVDLAPLRLAAQVPAAIAAAVGVEPAGRDAAKALAAALQGRRALIVIDNCEHLVDAVAAVAAALRAGAPTLHLLATSQVPLQLAGESVVRLEPLALPPPRANADEARTFGAFRLLEERAREADHRFRIGNGVIAMAIDICRRLDGLPLAIEMAAARLPALGVSGVHAMLVQPQSGTAALANPRRDAPGRHASLRATLQWNVGLLDANERTALAALAAFAGPFDTGMAQTMIAAEAAPELLASLVEKSLVHVERREPPRWRLLESLRAYAMEALQPTPACGHLRPRHGAAMRALSQRWRRFRSSGNIDEDAALAEIAPHISDIEQAFGAACDAGDAEVAADTLFALTWIDQLRGDYVDTEQRLLQALAVLPAARNAARARILTCIATRGWIRLPGLTAEQAAAEAARLWRAIDPGGIDHVHTLFLLATELARSGHSHRARRTLATAHRFAGDRARGYTRLVQLALSSYVDWFNADWKRSFETARSALQLARASNLPRSLTIALYPMPELAWRAVGADLALRYARLAVREARTRGMRRYLFDALLEVVWMASETGALAMAAEKLDELAGLAEDLGTELHLAHPYAHLALRAGQSVIGAELLGCALAQATPPRNRKDAADLATLHGLRAMAEQQLGAKQAAALLARGAQADARRVLELVNKLR